MSIEPEAPQQLQWLYWLVVAPVATAVTTLMYLLGKRKSGGENNGPVDKERERLKEEVATLLRKTERNQTDRDIAIACHELEEEFDRKLAVMRRDMEENLQQVIKATREPLDRRLMDTERQIIDIKRQRYRRAPSQSK